MWQFVFGILLIAIAPVIGWFGARQAAAAWEKMHAVRPAAPQPATASELMQSNTGSVNVGNNAGLTQVVVNSPGTTQIANQKRVLRRAVTSQNINRGDQQVGLRVQLDQTDGFWGGERFHLQLQLSRPYTGWRFVEGIPNATMDVREANDPANGVFDFSTAPPPNAGAIVLEFDTNGPVELKEIRAVPTE